MEIINIEMIIDTPPDLVAITLWDDLLLILSFMPLDRKSDWNIFNKMNVFNNDIIAINMPSVII